MEDLTCKEYTKIIEALVLDEKVKSQALFWIKPLSKDKEKNFSWLSEDADYFALDVSRIRYPYLPNNIFNILGCEYKQFLKYSKWKQGVVDAAYVQLEKLSGSDKNLFFTNLYSLFKNTEELSLLKPENRDLFTNLFTLATKLKTKNEEQSVVYALHDIFKNKETIGLDFFKELFAIYLENISTDTKYQSKVNEIKAWGENQDFSDLGKKYKNIRNLYTDTSEEQIFSTSIKKYNLKEIAAKTNTKPSIVQKNFDALGQFINEKLDKNSNIQNFIVIDEKIFHKVLIVYEKRDLMIDSAIKMHELFFSMIKGSDKVENDLMKSLWDSLILKSEIEHSFAQKDGVEKKPESARKSQKI